jgi:alkylation response protein AidB-like acyl-CoA dehydrogenase
MVFFQEPPQLGNQYDDDALLGEYLERALPREVMSELSEELRHLGGLGAEMYVESLRDRENEPGLVQWDPWGRRIDRIDITPLWEKAKVISAEHGLVAAAYEKRYGEHARVHQFAANYLVQASLDIYSCPLAMTDGATRTLLDLENRALIERAVPRLTSRDPQKMWTSGQWMTERTGGSDVGISETVAKQDGDRFRLYGTKWFTSATTSEMALTLGRPEGNGPGGRGLALFYVELRDDAGRMNNISINRLKDKLGTRKVPTAELTLEGTLATPVSGTEHGIRNIASMLNVTRLWNSIAAAWGARRCVALAKEYARKRVAFGAPLAEKPLHVDTLAWIAAEQEAIFHLAFRTAELMGRVESRAASELEERLIRIITPIVKLTTAKQGVALASETLEAFGGAGYIEDTGLPVLLRDAQVLPIWEGTTNVLSLDTIRALGVHGTVEALKHEVERTLGQVKDPSLKEAAESSKKGFAHAEAWLAGTGGKQQAIEAGARRFALTLGRSLELALMLSHAQWCLDRGKGSRAAAAARRFARHGVDLIDDRIDDADSRALAT